jgi:hypothetical protein
VAFLQKVSRKRNMKKSSTTPKASGALSGGIDDLMQLVHSGRLFALQNWIKAGKPLHLRDAKGRDSSVLSSAIETGFHSLVEELLRAGGWSPAELAAALETAQSTRRFEIAALLEEHGARPKPESFETSCDKLDLFMMERHLRSGVDANHDNVFAQVLSSKKARPLLRFYRQFRAEFPALDDQAALALAEAVKNNEVRWTALLAWAGADPFRPVPGNLEISFPIDPEDFTTAASEAVWRGRPDILKVLHLKPTSSQARALLSSAAYLGDLNLFRSLLSAIPGDQINDTERGSCEALESTVSRSPHSRLFGPGQDDKKDAENLQCVELLLDAGARWNPPLEDLRTTRRHIVQHDGRYIVQLLRLLLYTPNAVDVVTFLELCRSQSIQTKIYAADVPFSRDLHELRIAQRRAAATVAKTADHALSASDASTKTETAPAAGNVPVHAA